MKKYLFAILVLSVILSFRVDTGNPAAESGKLSGSVTYKDTHSAPAIADAGSRIYIISEENVIQPQYSNMETVIDIFKQYKSDYTRFQYNVVDPGRIKKSLDQFDTLSAFNNRLIRGFIRLPGMMKTVAGESGSFSVNVKPGKYYILVVSGNVRSNNATELNGNIDFKTVEVRPGGECVTNFQFIRHDMIWIVPMTKRPEGC